MNELQGAELLTELERCTDPVMWTWWLQQVGGGMTLPLGHGADRGRTGGGAGVAVRDGAVSEPRPPLR